MEKVGARLWIARIMITWGIFAGLTALVTGPTSFSVVRFLLGAAEAGFFPGIVLYFTYWFPAHHHGRIVSGFLIGLPIAVAGGAPISTALLGLDGVWGLHGWQWMYIAEAVPTIADRRRHILRAHRQAGAGDVPDRRGEDLAQREAARPSAGPRRRCRTFSLWQGMFDQKVLLLALNYFGIVVASLGVLIFVPQIIKSLGT